MAWLMALSTNFKLIFFATLFLAGLASGIWIERLIFRSSEVGDLKAQIKSLKDTTDAQSEIGRVIAARNAALVETNNKLQTKIDQTYDKTPAIANPCISAIRLSLVNQQRAAANSRAR